MTYHTLNNKKILLGLSGGIAAYKACELVRQLRAVGAEVQVCLTQSAQAFVAPLSLQTLSGRAVKTDLFSLESEAEIDHISLARWPDILLIAPASANFMAKLAHGLADDLLSTLCLAAEQPILLAPAMNRAMWSNPATQANSQLLVERGMTLLGPACGEQACGETGLGRLLEVDQLLAALQHYFVSNHQGLLTDKQVVITAGPTREAIDPVRYLTNHSSGKMGYALAEAALAAGAQVTLISGPTSLTPVENVSYHTVETALQMQQTVDSVISSADIFIAAAAVADYRLLDIASSKIKKTAANKSLTLELIANPDILQSVTARDNPPFTVGFAAETDNLLQNADEKRRRKAVDLLCANLVGDNLGFNCDDNAVTLLTAAEPVILPRASKKIIAAQIIQQIAGSYHAKNSSKNS